MNSAVKGGTTLPCVTKSLAQFRSCLVSEAAAKRPQLCYVVCCLSLCPMQDEISISGVTFPFMIWHFLKRILLSDTFESGQFWSSINLPTVQFPEGRRVNGLFISDLLIFFFKASSMLIFKSELWYSVNTWQHFKLLLLLLLGQYLLVGFVSKESCYVTIGLSTPSSLCGSTECRHSPAHMKLGYLKGHTHHPRGTKYLLTMAWGLR